MPALRIAFPDGEIDLLCYFSERMDEAMLQRLAEVDLETLRIRDRIKTAVRLRLEVMAPFREAARRGANLFAMPFYATRAASCLYRTVDAIWFGIGDRSTDFNFYSKRAILAGVFASTITFWFGDTSDAFEATWRFLDRRIDDVMQIEKAKALVRRVGEQIPSPLDLIDRLMGAGPRFRS
jgi:ubiquinone biosynthesis protein COQ9